MIGRAIGRALGGALKGVVIILACLLGYLLLVTVVRYGPVKSYYGLKEGVEPDRVTIMPEPHDCDFSKAPIGDKECHYEKVVTRLQDKQGDHVVVDWRRVSEANGGTPCNVKAELRSINVRAVYNPNSIELWYQVTNESGKTYEFPDTFRALRKSSDGILHDDENDLGLPANRLFPEGHTVEFSVWLNIGNVFDHNPTDNEKSELEKRLAGTQSYVLFDETHHCELELPVHR